MSYPSIPGRELAYPPSKNCGQKPSALFLSFLVPQGPSVVPLRPRHLPPGMPFDPEELARRLEVLERKQIARERVKDARAVLKSSCTSKRLEASPMSGCSNSDPLADQQAAVAYRHVPSNAASQFARTTINDSIRGAELVHCRSQRKLRPLGLNKKISTIENRAQIQNGTITEDVMMSVGSIDKEANPRQRPHTIEGKSVPGGQSPRAPGHGDHARHQSASTTSGRNGTSKRASIASFEADGKTRHSWLLLSPSKQLQATTSLTDWSESQEQHSQHQQLEPLNAAATVNEHRVDWTQRDEEVNIQVDARQKALSRTGSPKLKKIDSIWTLRRRLGSFGQHNHQDKDKDKDREKVAQSSISPSSLKSPTSVFFAKFKRR